MRKLSIIGGAFLILLIHATTFAQQSAAVAEPTEKLTLDNCLASAIKNNPGLLAAEKEAEAISGLSFVANVSSNSHPQF